jgi:hypothetical protein
MPATTGTVTVTIHATELDDLKRLLADLASGPGYLRREGADTARRLLDTIQAGGSWT